MVPDLLGCQFLIIDASIQYDSNGWMGYNQWFHLNAAANSKHVPVLMLHYGIGPSLAMPRFSDANTTFALHMHLNEWAPEATDAVTSPPQPSSQFSIIQKNMPEVE